MECLQRVSTVVVNHICEILSIEFINGPASISSLHGYGKWDFASTLGMAVNRVHATMKEEYSQSHFPLTFLMKKMNLRTMVELTQGNQLQLGLLERN